VLITDLELEYDTPAVRKCGECGECMEACPTGAIVEPGLVDARKCISYWTVEHRGEFPEEVRKELRGRIFGCDICQETCPWNENVPVSPMGDFAPREGIANPDLEWMANLSHKEYDERFLGSVMRRAGYEGLRRSARGVVESKCQELKPPGKKLESP
jgi:epoxyqueuosine reductase